jgi:hypothetical protein
MKRKVNGRLSKTAGQRDRSPDLGAFGRDSHEARRGVEGINRFLGSVLTLDRTAKRQRNAAAADGFSLPLEAAAEGSGGPSLAPNRLDSMPAITR